MYCSTITTYLFFIFFQVGTVTNPTIWLVLSAVRIFLSLTMITVTLAWVFFPWVFFHLRAWKKINKLFTGLRSVRIVKNCDLGLENAARGRRPRAAFSRPRSQLFTIRTSQLANNIYYIFRDSMKWRCLKLSKVSSKGHWQHDNSWYFVWEWPETFTVFNFSWSRVK